jgi:dolichol-phosphate mannosyltransferase
VACGILYEKLSRLQREFAGRKGFLTMQRAPGDSDTLVIVPTYNERENIPRLVEELRSLEAAVDLLIVDDNSPDGTGELAGRLARQHHWIHVLHRKTKEGLGRAYCAGFAWALERDYEFVFEMDGDLSHDPREIPVFLEAAADADLVLGSRYSKGIRVINWPLKRLMLSLCAAKYVQIITGMPFSDPTGGFKCFRRRTLQCIDWENVDSNGYSFQIEVTHKVWREGMRIVEVPIIFTDRFHGTSKMSPRIVREALKITWKMLFQNRLSRSPRKNTARLEQTPGH